MPILYEQYLTTLLRRQQWNTIYKHQEQERNHHIGFQFRGYEGLVAKKTNDIQKPKQGLFDFFIYTTDRYIRLFNHKAPTHYNLLRDLTRHSSLKNCEKVWHGDTLIENISNNPEEIASLTILSLMMFEQEINYGDLDFQRRTQFSPSKNMRPRDMLMGFTRLAFSINIEDYPYWDGGKEKNPKCYPDFNGSFDKLEEKYKQYFNYYTQDYNDVLALVNHQSSRRRLLAVANHSPANPNYKP